MFSLFLLPFMSTLFKSESLSLVSFCRLIFFFSSHLFLCPPLLSLPFCINCDLAVCVLSLEGVILSQTLGEMRAEDIALCFCVCVCHFKTECVSCVNNTTYLNADSNTFAVCAHFNYTHFDFRPFTFKGFIVVGVLLLCTHKCL